jgi:D-sedoheptulose 7-phosphate isomerase
VRGFIEAELDQMIGVISAVRSDAALVATIAEIAQIAVAALRRGNKILLAGNGDSAADSQHLAAELVGRFNFDRPGLPAITLTTDTSALTGIGNDYGFERLFARQIEALGNQGDLFFAISTSGRSPNVLAALKTARERGLVTIGLTGQSGGEMVALCDHCLRMPSAVTPKIQEGHITIGHILFALVEREMFGAGR